MGLVDPITNATTSQSQDDGSYDSSHLSFPDGRTEELSESRIEYVSRDSKSYCYDIADKHESEFTLFEGWCIKIRSFAIQLYMM